MQILAHKAHSTWYKISVIRILQSSLLSIVFLTLSLFLAPPNSHAQTPPTQNIPVNTAPYAAPDYDPGVPLNQHTFVQSILIEAASASLCLLTGVDPINPSQGCLDINPVTHKLTLAPPSNNPSQHGGLLGIVPSLYSQIYTPPASSTQYVRYLADNFGIVKPVHAQNTSNGFKNLEPIQAIWVAVRNITYLAFVVIFILMGLGIMLRIKIDPRTVMTLQNQIPRVIIGILLITFSYAIVGLMIDIMWSVTFMGINVITESGGSTTNPVVQGTGCPEANLSLQKRATDDLHTFSVFSYAQSILTTNCSTVGILDLSGIPAVSWGVSRSIGNTVQDLINFAFYGRTTDLTSNCSIGGFLGKAGQTLNFVNPIYWAGLGIDSLVKAVYPGAANVPAASGPPADSADSCFAYIMSGVVGFFIKIVVVLIVVCIILWTLFRIWLDLLRAYVMIILYTITGPLWIIMGLLPGRPLGFGAWFRRIVANLAVFPATALLLVTASYLLYAFGNLPANTTVFVPPLVGNPDAGSIGYLLAFGILLVTPSLLNIIKSSFNAVGKQGMMATQSITNMMAGGASGPKGFGRMAKNRLFAGYDPTREHMGVGWQVLGGRNPTSLRFRLVHGLGGTGMTQDRFARYDSANPSKSGGSGKKTKT